MPEFTQCHASGLGFRSEGAKLSDNTCRLMWEPSARTCTRGCKRWQAQARPKRPNNGKRPTFDRVREGEP
eukprot:1367800-Amphidinium_carterae.1